MNRLDLDLWQDENLIRRQNQLKYQFWELLGEIGDLFPQEDLVQVHSNSKGKKLSQGQDLGGLPYQVLDLIRDFDFETGLNIRLLNWFGKGLFLFVLAGKSSYPKLQLSPANFQLCQSESPWDYQAILLGKPNEKQAEHRDFNQWFKELKVESSIEKNKNDWQKEIRDVFDHLIAHSVKSQI
jgi:hypothetical protein